jgi:hypothetical protein
MQPNAQLTTIMEINNEGFEIKEIKKQIALVRASAKVSAFQCWGFKRMTKSD